MGDYRQVGGDDGVHSGLPGGGAQGLHRLQLFIIHDDVQRQVGLSPRLMAAGHDFRQVFL